MVYYKKFLKLIRILKEKKTGCVDFSHSRPLHSEDFNLRSDNVINEKKIGIVMQGPIITDNDFTLETIKIYAKTFSKASTIIISTWLGEDVETVKKLRDLGATIIENEKPKHPGIKNINFQIVSSRNGIQKAKTFGVSHILKTRTDQRMYAPNVEEFLSTIIDTFPLTHPYNQKKRIVVVSLNTYKYRPYSVSDMTLFGTLEDMEVYFSPDEDLRTTPHFNNIKTWSEDRLCEVYLSTTYLEKIGRKLDFTLEDSWHVFAEHFCVIDSQTLDIFWYKYEYWKEYGDLSYTKMKNTQELNFREWLTLYGSLTNKAEIPEKVIEGQFGATL